MLESEQISTGGLIGVPIPDGPTRMEELAGELAGKIGRLEQIQ